MSVDDAIPKPTRVPVAFDALRTAISRVPVWLACAVLFGLLGWLAALPEYGQVQSAADHRYEAGSLLRELDVNFRTDHRDELRTLDASSRAIGAGLALAAMLLGAFCAGGWLQVLLERTEGHSMRRFFHGGARYFFRFFRVLLCTLALLQLCGWLVYGWPWEWLVLNTVLGVKEVSELTSELSAQRVAWLQDGLYLWLFALVMAWGDYTRTRLALHDTNSSIWAGLCTFATFAAHPLRALAPLAVITLIEGLLLMLAGAARPTFEAGLAPDGGSAPIVALFILSAYALCARAIARGARYAAAVAVSRAVVRPIARPDPWKGAIGGPGGPRYPITESSSTEALGV